MNYMEAMSDDTLDYLEPFDFQCVHSEIHVENSRDWSIAFYVTVVLGILILILMCYFIGVLIKNRYPNPAGPPIPLETIRGE